MFYFLPQVEKIVRFQCPFHLLTGYYCPGCGSLRGLHSLVHGNIIGALRNNLLMVISFPYLIYSFVLFSYKEISGKELKRVFIKPVYIWLLLAFILLFWVLRNIPSYPFSLLAPQGS
jgi:Ca2+/Na+ antiporter